MQSFRQVHQVSPHVLSSMFTRNALKQHSSKRHQVHESRNSPARTFLQFQQAQYASHDSHQFPHDRSFIHKFKLSICTQQHLPERCMFGYQQTICFNTSWTSLHFLSRFTAPVDGSNRSLMRTNWLPNFTLPTPPTALKDRIVEQPVSTTAFASHKGRSHCCRLWEEGEGSLISHVERPGNSPSKSWALQDCCGRSRRYRRQILQETKKKSH